MIENGSLTPEEVEAEARVSELSRFLVNGIIGQELGTLTTAPLQPNFIRQLIRHNKKGESTPTAERTTYVLSTNGKGYIKDKKLELSAQLGNTYNQNEIYQALSKSYVLFEEKINSLHISLEDKQLQLKIYKKMLASIRATVAPKSKQSEVVTTEFPFYREKADESEVRKKKAELVKVEQGKIQLQKNEKKRKRPPKIVTKIALGVLLGIVGVTVALGVHYTRPVAEAATVSPILQEEMIGGGVTEVEDNQWVISFESNQVSTVTATHEMEDTELSDQVDVAQAVINDSAIVENTDILSDIETDEIVIVDQEIASSSTNSNQLIESLTTAASGALESQLQSDLTENIESPHLEEVAQSRVRQIMSTVRKVFSPLRLVLNRVSDLQPQTVTSEAQTEAVETEIPTETVTPAPTNTVTPTLTPPPTSSPTPQPPTEMPTETVTSTSTEEPTNPPTLTPTEESTEFVEIEATATNTPIPSQDASATEIKQTINIEDEVAVNEDDQSETVPEEIQSENITSIGEYIWGPEIRESFEGRRAAALGDGTFEDGVPADLEVVTFEGKTMYVPKGTDPENFDAYSPTQRMEDLGVFNGLQELIEQNDLAQDQVNEIIQQRIDELVQDPYINMVFVMSDYRPDVGGNRMIGHADQVFAVRFDPVALKMQVIAIPRDLYSPVAAQEVGSLNEDLYQIESLTWLNQTTRKDIDPRHLERQVEMMGGFFVDGMETLNFNAIADLIDQLFPEKGMKIWLDQPFTIYVPDSINNPNQGYTIDLPAGEHYLTGQQVVEYARTRYTDGPLGYSGDIEQYTSTARAERQANIIQTLFNQLLRRVAEAGKDSLSVDAALTEFSHIFNTVTTSLDEYDSARAQLESGNLDPDYRPLFKKRGLGLTRLLQQARDVLGNPDNTTDLIRLGLPTLETLSSQSTELVTTMTVRAEDVDRTASPRDYYGPTRDRIQTLTETGIDPVAAEAALPKLIIGEGSGDVMGWILSTEGPFGENIALTNGQTLVLTEFVQSQGIQLMVGVDIIDQIDVFEAGLLLAKTSYSGYENELQSAFDGVKYRGKDRSFYDDWLAWYRNVRDNGSTQMNKVLSDVLDEATPTSKVMVQDIEDAFFRDGTQVASSN